MTFMRQNEELLEIVKVCDLFILGRNDFFGDILEWRKKIGDVLYEIETGLLIYKASFICDFVESGSEFLAIGKKGFGIIFGFLAIGKRVRGTEKNGDVLPFKHSLDLVQNIIYSIRLLNLKLRGLFTKGTIIIFLKLKDFNPT